jgi:AcrR family transcriptional regulator
MRDRFRAQVRDDIKRAALGQLAAAGLEGLSINAIAKELGVSGPALYRYFAGRDELLTELIVDAYDDLAATLTGAEDLDDVARRYRAWALEQPHRYRLLFGPPLPGYDAHAERLVTAARRSMDVLLQFADADEAVVLWSRLHGFVSLEIGGNFASMGLDADALFRRAL